MRGLVGLAELGATALLTGCLAQPDVAAIAAAEHRSTLARLQSELFDARCASSSCHGAGREAGGLLLDAAHAYDALVDAPPLNPAARARGMMRVRPAHPEASFLLAKLQSGLPADQGEPMPWRAAAIPAEELALLEAWITAGAPHEGRVPGDDGGAPTTMPPPTSPAPELAPPTRGVQLDVSTSVLPTTGELTECRFLKLPSDVDLEVDHVQLATSVGSHHIHLYRALRPDLAREDGAEPCASPVDFADWQLLFASERPTSDWQLHPGVAFHVAAREQLLLEAHFLPAGASAEGGRGRVLVNLGVSGRPVVEHAGAIFGQVRDIAIPGGATVLVSGRCVFPRAIQVMAEAGHYHLRGRRFSVYHVDGGARGAELYRHEGFDDPPFVQYDASSAPEVDAGGGLEWECLYVNDGTEEIDFGPTAAKNEHCALFAFYHPAHGLNESITCVEEDGASHTEAR